MKPTFYNCPVCKLYYDNDEGRDPGDGQTLEEIAFAYGTDGWEQLPDKPCGCGAFADRFYRIEDRELNTVLAALRYWQRCGDFGGGGIQDIATNGGTEQALESDEIDTLCERLNTQERVGWKFKRSASTASKRRPDHAKRQRIDLDRRQIEALGYPETGRGDPQ